MLNVNLWRIWRPSSRPTLASLFFPAAAHTEAGWMAGVGMRVIVFIPEMVEPEFMYKLFDVVTGDLDTLINVSKLPVELLIIR